MDCAVFVQHSSDIVSYIIVFAILYYVQSQLQYICYAWLEILEGVVRLILCWKMGRCMKKVEN